MLGCVKEVVFQGSVRAHQLEALAVSFLSPKLILILSPKPSI